MAGRPRKPTNVLKLSGAFLKNPQRLAARANEPKPTGEIGEPPEEFTDEEKRMWREIVADAPPGVLSNANRGLLMVTAPLQLHALKGDPYVTEGGVVMENIRVRDQKKLALLLRCYTELGFTPASQSKVQAKPREEKEQNEFAAV